MTSEKTEINPEQELKQIREELELLVEKMELALKDQQQLIKMLHTDQKISARNLIRYLALRSEDVRSLQDRLHALGLSSLASSESHILRQVQAILERLNKKYQPSEISTCTNEMGRRLNQKKSDKLFGSKKGKSIPYLMVTFDAEFSEDYPLIKSLLEAGMNVARINCAHDNKLIWQNMIKLVHKASKETGLPCKIYMDLAGPKMRVSVLGKGHLLDKVDLREEQEILLAEKNARFNKTEIVLGCDEPNIIKQLIPGHRVLFDDGLIESIVMSVEKGIARIRIKRISGKKPVLKAHKGINFPDTQLTLPALTERDISLIPFICKNADLVGYSFVRDVTCVKTLQDMLAGHKKRPHIIIKIETPEAVKNFPSLLIQGMHEEVFGVMIARGDLAVEIGFERLSEIQEEILWISEAAHVPVIWATQVMETLNKSGIATRAEVTDASYAAMAECVMLNKGDYIMDVMRSLRDILERSGRHHVKKRYTFRPMQIAKDFFDTVNRKDTKPGDFAVN
jgi:pyruvate kinase